MKTSMPIVIVCLLLLHPLAAHAWLPGERLPPLALAGEATRTSLRETTAPQTVQVEAEFLGPRAIGRLTAPGQTIAFDFDRGSAHVDYWISGTDGSFNYSMPSVLNIDESFSAGYGHLAFLAEKLQGNA